MLSIRHALEHQIEAQTHLHLWGIYQLAEIEFAQNTYSLAKPKLAEIILLIGYCISVIM